MDHSPFCTKSLESVIDDVFNLYVPGRNYRVVCENEEETAGIMTRVNELPAEYITPFSSTDYDYKLDAIFKSADHGDWLACIKPADYTIVYAYRIMRQMYEREHKRDVTNMRAFIATYIALGESETLKYEY